MKKLIYICAVLLAFTGCLKDRSLTDYEDIILPELNNPDQDPDKLVEGYEYLKANEQILELHPDITYEGEDELSFKWMIDGKDVSDENLSEDPKNLKWKVHLDKDLVYCALYVKRVKADNDVIFQFRLKLDKPYERGYVVVTDNGGKVQYNLYSDALVNGTTIYTPHPAIMSTDTSVEDWIDCVEFWAPETYALGTLNPIGHMFHLEKNPQKCFSVDELSMSSRTTLVEEFFQGELPEEVNSFVNVAYGGYVSYLLGDNGKLYEKLGGNGFYTGKYISTLPVQYEGQDLVVSDLIRTPYKADFILVREKESGDFLTLSLGFPDGPNTKAGKLQKLPVDKEHPEDLNTFQGDEIVYSRLLLKAEDRYARPGPTEMPYTLFMVSKDKESGEYSASEYYIETEGSAGVIYTTKVYDRSPIPGFGPNSIIIPLETKYVGISPAALYYTDSSDPARLMVAKRTSKGLSNVQEWHRFESPVVAMDSGTFGSSYAYMAVGLQNRDAVQLGLDVSTAFKYRAPEECTGKQKPTERDRWTMDGDILRLDYRFGNMQKYHSR